MLRDIDRASTPGFLRAHRARWKVRLAGWILKRTGWRVTGAFPHERRLVIVAAPHTSNWDFVIAVLAMYAYDLHINWLGKHSLFRWPLGPLMRVLGGVAVNRQRADGVADQVAERMSEADHMWLIITPEGTRKAVPRWKSGFLRIAAAAECPLLLVSLDYRQRELKLGEEITVSEHLVSDPDELEAQLAVIQHYYHRYTPRYPERFHTG